MTAMANIGDHICKKIIHYKSKGGLINSYYDENNPLIFENKRIQLVAGDKILLYTDGITEAEKEEYNDDITSIILEWDPK